ncbi:MAG: polysaccharide deacetylase family protein [Deltaproteobacteria bacterium]|nr:polysaccharide deacetylase family protein [Deltaproteobacteria bacterium]
MRRILIVVAATIAAPAGGVPLPEQAAAEREPEPPQFAHGLPTNGETGRRWLLLTFDDGPRPSNTLLVARYLAREGIPAVFFVNGIHMMGPTSYPQRNRRIVAELAAMGFEIGNHGLTHARLGPLLAHETAKEIVENEELIAEVTGRVPWLFRPPYGSLPLVAAGIAEARGLTVVGWNLGTADFIEQSPQDILHTFRKRLEKHEEEGVRGGIIVLHDAHPWTVEALPLLVDWVRRRNCELLARDEELYEFVDFRRFWVPRGRHPGPTPPDARFPANEPTVGEALAWQGRERRRAERYCGRP